MLRRAVDVLKAIICITHHRTTTHDTIVLFAAFCLSNIHFPPPPRSPTLVLKAIAHASSHDHTRYDCNRTRGSDCNQTRAVLRRACICCPVPAQMTSAAQGQREKWGLSRRRCTKVPGGVCRHQAERRSLVRRSERTPLSQRERLWEREGGREREREGE